MTKVTGLRTANIMKSVMESPQRNMPDTNVSGINTLRQDISRTIMALNAKRAMIPKLEQTYNEIIQKTGSSKFCLYEDARKFMSNPFPLQPGASIPFMFAQDGKYDVSLKADSKGEVFMVLMENGRDVLRFNTAEKGLIGGT